jgi:hypothetical protein
LGNSSGLTLGISSSLFGTGYSGFYPRWWAGIESLNRQPDAIVIAHDARNKEEVLANIPEQYKDITKTIELEGTYTDYRRAMQESQTTDWISVGDVDDQYLPGAFDELDQADAEGCDIYIDKVQFKHNGSILEGRWIPEKIPYEMTCPGNAPIKKTLYDKTGGTSSGTYFDDWELYIRCVHAGAKPYHASTIRLIHDLGHDRVTLSGVNRSMAKDQESKEAIARVRQELGF